MKRIVQADQQREVLGVITANSRPNMHGGTILNHICIINSHAHSGGAGAIVDRVGAALRRRGADAKIVQADSGQEIADLVAKAVLEGHERVLVGGGDGTINAAASAMLGSRAVLAVLPLGTLNHFAKDLGIPLDVEGAVDNAFSGTEIAIDVGEVNDRIFLNNSSIGLYPGIVADREGYQKRGHSKWAALIPAVADAIWRYSPLTVSLNASGQRDIATTTPFVFVGNNRYETHPPSLGRRISLTTGLLWFCRAPHASRSQLIAASLKALTGLGSVTELADFDAPDCEIRGSRKRIRVALDGEVVKMSLPLRYKVRPKALKVIVPA